MVHSRTLAALALASALALATPSHALTFNFSFDNVTGNVPGTVTGTITGLEDNVANQLADAVFINSAPSVFGLSLPFSVPLLPGGPFTVASGVITDAFFVGNFFIGDAIYTLGLVKGSSISQTGQLLRFDPTTLATLNLTTGINGLPPTFSAVPGPVAGAGLPSLILAGFGLLSWWRRKWAAA